MKQENYKFCVKKIRFLELYGFSPESLLSRSPRLGGQDPTQHPRMGSALYSTPGWAASIQHSTPGWMANVPQSERSSRVFGTTKQLVTTMFVVQDDLLAHRISKFCIQIQPASQ